MKFCANPNCEFHIEVENNKREIYKISSIYRPLSIIKQKKPEEIHLAKVKEIKNHTYYKKERLVIFFCDVCHLAIQAYLSFMSK